MKQILILLFLTLSLSFSAQKIATSLTYSVNLPAKKTVKTPVLILLHGYGSNEADLFDLSHAVDSRFITFSLRGPTATDNGGFCWYPLEFLADQQFRYDYKKATESRDKIRSFISNACKAYGVDSTQVFILGFSQGAIMAYDLALHIPAKIKGILALSGRLMDETKQLPVDWAQADRVKVFIAHGTADNRIKAGESQKAADFLEANKVTDVTHKTYNMPHSLNGAEINDIKTWLIKAIAPVEKSTVPKNNSAQKH